MGDKGNGWLDIGTKQICIILLFPLLILCEQDLGFWVVHASGMRCSLQDMHEHSGKDREDIKFAYLKDSYTIFLCCRSKFFP